MADVPIEFFLADEAATARLGNDLAQAVKTGDVIALQGDLGAGKTTLARAMIRSLAGNLALEVPSPTFTLVQVYEMPVAVAHYDLYRLSSPRELTELGLSEALEHSVVLVEWPERAEGTLPENTVHVSLAQVGDGRLARINGTGAAVQRIERSLAMRDFLASAGWGDATRRPLSGDASARTYETVALEGQPSRLLMNSPPLVLGPTVKDGKAYAEIAHTSRTVAAFVAVGQGLAAAGVPAPHIYAQDLDRGFLLIENLGSDGIVDAQRQPIAERYEAAGELLAFLHEKPWSARLPVGPGLYHDVPPFDRDAMMIEVELLLQWYVPWATGKPATETLLKEFTAEWDCLIERLRDAEIGLVQRDYHSPNIIWRGERSGRARLGVIDFQDALIGPVAYDLASLAMDARVTIPRELEKRVVDAYVKARSDDFDAEKFAESCAIMAAQRNSKILGIFVRLDRRDGKPNYLKHLDRTRDYLERSFEHPALAGLAKVYRRHGLLDTALK